MIAAGIGALSLGLINAHDWGWASARTIGTLAAGGILAGAFVRRCGRHPSPVVELSLLRVPRFAVAAASTFVYGIAYSSALLATTVWVQAGWGWSPLRFGLAFAAGPLMVPLLTPLVGRIIHLAGAGVTAAIGGAVFTASALVRAFLIGQTPDYPSALLPAVLLTGVGVAFALPTLIGAGSASLPPHRFATGSGVLNMAPQFGYTAGVATAVAILGSPNPGHASLVVFHHTWFVTAALGVVMTAIAIQLARHDNSGTAVAASGPAAPDEQRSSPRTPIV
jgi:hypothetical protein